MKKILIQARSQGEGREGRPTPLPSRLPGPPGPLTDSHRGRRNQPLFARATVRNDRRVYSDKLWVRARPADGNRNGGS